MQVEFYRHGLGEAEKNSMLRALGNTFLTTGPLTEAFEKRFAGYLGCSRAVGTSSCTTALFFCLKALGIGEGDEVITTPLTFVATANAIIEAGARPVFADVEPETGNLDLAAVEKAVTPRTRAVIPVHLYGQMCDMRAFAEMAERRGIDIIEDSAHCIEGRRDGLRPGQAGRAACFSFYATKNMTSGEGGAVATSDEALADAIQRLRSHGMNKEAADRYHAPYRHWDMVSMGYKGNMFDLQAALLLPQFSTIEKNLEARERISRRYREAFADIPAVAIPRILPNTRHAHHLFTIRVPAEARDNALADLQAQGVGVAVNYRPVHLLTYYRESFAFGRGVFPNAERIGDRTLSLPFYPALRADEVDYVIAAVRNTMGRWQA